MQRSKALAIIPLVVLVALQFRQELIFGHDDRILVFIGIENITATTDAFVDAKDRYEASDINYVENRTFLNESWHGIDVLPPNTPGAFIHVPKTAGSTLSKYLRFACHSWVPKPCQSRNKVIEKQAPKDSYLSRFTTYYHNPDFERLRNRMARSQYEFLVFSTRDPLSRWVSAYRYMNQALGGPKENFAKQRQELYTCFPTLQSFVEVLGEPPYDFEWPYNLNHVGNNRTLNCTALARATFQHRVKHLFHFFFDYRFIMDAAGIKVKNNSSNLQTTNLKVKGTPDIFVIRLEELWKDWSDVNFMLGQSPETIQTFPDGERGRDLSRTKKFLSVQEEVGDVGRKRLCIALKEEYDAYLRLISSAKNLSPAEKGASLAVSQKACPWLNLAIPESAVGASSVV